MNDLRFAFRQLLKNPGFTAVAVLTLAICVGANLAIFAVVDAILVRSLPLPQADRLVVIHNAYPASGVERGQATITDYFERRGEVDALESLSLFREQTYIVGEQDAARWIPGAEVTPDFFRTIGVPLAQGRPFTEEELNYASDTVAIITDQFWRDHFAADTNVLSRTFLMDSLPVRIIGVMPAGFRFLSTRAQIYRPASHFRETRDLVSRFAPGTYTLDGRDPVTRYTARARMHDGQMVGRLRSGRSLAEAQSQLSVLNARRLERDSLGGAPKAAAYYPWVEPLHAAHVSSARSVLLLVQAGALILLVMGGVNLAGLLLIRASGRAREMAIRQVLGAGRATLARGILIETLVLSSAGGACGAVVATSGLHLAESLGLGALPLGTDVSFGIRTVGMAILLSLALGVGISLPILWLHLRRKTDVSLPGGWRGATTGPAVQRLRHGLIVTQMAFACVLLYGAGLLGLSLRQSLREPPGFDPVHVVSGHLVLPWQRYEARSATAGFLSALLDRLRAIPGVTHAALSTSPPFTKPGSSPGGIFPEGFRSDSDSSLHHLSSVTSDYARAMGIPLLQGRFLESPDCRADAPRVAVIDEALANLYWPNGDAIGRRFCTDPSVFDPELAYTVVGIVGTVKQQQLTETTKLGAAYLPLREADNFQVVVRTSTPEVVTASTLQRIVRQLDPGLPLVDFKSMPERIDESSSVRRSPTLFAGLFAGVALLLAGLGTYGVLAYAVAQRRREVGIRLALGATPQRVCRNFLALGSKLLSAGVVVGLLGAWAAGWAMRSVLFGVPPLDFTLAAGVIATLTVATLLASLLPALRASRISPMEAMQGE